MIFSNTAIIVVNAAKLKNKKNKAPQIFPNCIFAKILGNVWKINPGPCPGSTLYAKQAGITIKPATNATNVSKHTTVTASDVNFLLLSM